MQMTKLQSKFQNLSFRLLVNIMCITMTASSPSILKAILNESNRRFFYYLRILSSKLKCHMQANRDITRMEIFMSPVQLLEQTVKGSAGPVGALENGDMMVHLAFPQTTSIPATGMPSGLQ